MEMESIVVETASRVRNVFVGQKPTQRVMHPRTCKTMAEFAAMYDDDNTSCAVCGNGGLWRKSSQARNFFK